jgi:hypothetical protein
MYHHFVSIVFLALTVIVRWFLLGEEGRPVVHLEVVPKVPFGHLTWHRFPRLSNKFLSSVAKDVFNHP